VFLAVTGAEALYADLGHFGKAPIRIAWIAIVLPALTLNYFGQGAALLLRPELLENPFFLTVPAWSLMPMVGLATAATIIASQAVITGAFSLTRQAVQLGLLPRMQVNFTSAQEAGQIYMPQVNWLLFAGVVALTLIFQSSSALSTAYGIAVTGTMVVTSILAIFVIKNRWKWRMGATLAVMLPLLAMDLVFLGANSLKIAEGGWVPLVLGFAGMCIMAIWRKGQKDLLKSSRKLDLPLRPFLNRLESSDVHRISGNGVFLTSDAGHAPVALLHSLKHFKVLHENNIIVTVTTADTPYVDQARRAKITQHSAGFTAIVLEFGYLETPDIPKALAAVQAGFASAGMNTSYFLSRRNLVAASKIGMPKWLDRIFILLARNANDASAYFRLPPERVIEIGTQVAV
jgi:KUP system potassium uptake protein